MTLDPERFRISKGRGARWYVDDLPPCPIVPDADGPYEAPSWTTIAGAWPKFFVPWASGLVARMAVERPQEWQHLDTEAAVAVLKAEPDRVRDATAVRGTSIHSLLEQIAVGQEPMEALVPDAAPFLPTLRRYVAECKPRWILSEYVGFNRTIGYGCTGDAIKTHDALPGLGVTEVDYKTRNDVRCYPENAAQVVACGGVEYIMVHGENGPERARPPKIDGGLVVVFTPEDYGLFPVTIDADGLDGIRRLKDFWSFFRAAHTLIGRVVGAPASGPMVQLQRQWLVARVQAIKDHGDKALAFLAACWPQGVPTFKQSDEHDGAQLAAIEAVLDLVEKECSIPFGEPRPDPFPAEAAPTPGESAPAASVPVANDLATEEACQAFIVRLKALPSDLLASVESAAAQHKIPNLRSGRATVDELMLLEQFLDPVEEEAEGRDEEAGTLLTEYSGDLYIGMWLLACHGVNRSTLTEAELDNLRAVVAATDAGLLAATFTADGACSLVVTTGAEAKLLAAYGSKSNLLSVAKRHAETIGMTSPRSAAAACADPLLAALLHANQLALSA